LYKVSNRNKKKKKRRGKNVVRFPRPPNGKFGFSAFARLSLKVYIFKPLLKKHSKYRMMKTLK